MITLAQHFRSCVKLGKAVAKTPFPVEKPKQSQLVNCEYLCFRFRHRIISNPHQMSLTTNPLSVTGSVTASAPLLMGGEHSAFRSLVPSASTAAAILATSAQLGLTRPYNHSPTVSAWRIPAATRSQPFLMLGWSAIVPPPFPKIKPTICNQIIKLCRCPFHSCPSVQCTRPMANDPAWQQI